MRVGVWRFFRQGEVVECVFRAEILLNPFIRFIGFRTLLLLTYTGLFPTCMLIVCAITIGNVKQKLSTKEKLIHSLTHRKTKTVEQMYTSDSPVPDWFLSGMAAVQKAPSAVNRQPVTFSYKDGTVTASVENIDGEGFAFDLGIAKLHFEIGAGGGAWEFGNGAGFRVNGHSVLTAFPE